MTRQRAAVALKIIRPPAIGSVPDLQECLKSSDRYLQFHAALALLAIEPQLPPESEIIARISRDKTQPEFQRAALETLQQLGSRGSSALPELIDSLSEYEIVPIELLSVFRAIGIDAVPSLAKGLSNERLRVRVGCANALAFMNVRLDLNFLRFRCNLRNVLQLARTTGRAVAREAQRVIMSRLRSRRPTHSKAV